jgi:hypothetical protein
MEPIPIQVLFKKIGFGSSFGFNLILLPQVRVNG